MIRRRFKLDIDQMRIDMSWRLAISMAVGLIVGAACTVTWAYAYGNKLVATSDGNTLAVLRAYPTWPQVLQVIREEREQIKADTEARHSQVMKRLERIEDRLMRR